MKVTVIRVSLAQAASDLLLAASSFARKSTLNMGTISPAQRGAPHPGPSPGVHLVLGQIVEAAETGSVAVGDACVSPRIQVLTRMPVIHGLRQAQSPLSLLTETSARLALASPKSAVLFHATRGALVVTMDGLSPSRQSHWRVLGTALHARGPQVKWGDAARGAMPRSARCPVAARGTSEEVIHLAAGNPMNMRHLLVAGVTARLSGLLLEIHRRGQVEVKLLLK